REISIVVADAGNADRVGVAESLSGRTPAGPDVRAALARRNELINRAVTIDDIVVAITLFVERVDCARERWSARIVGDDRRRIPLECGPAAPCSSGDVNDPAELTDVAEIDRACTARPALAAHCTLDLIKREWLQPTRPDLRRCLCGARW